MICIRQFVNQSKWSTFYNYFIPARQSFKSRKLHTTNLILCDKSLKITNHEISKQPKHIFEEMLTKDGANKETFSQVVNIYKDKSEKKELAGQTNVGFIELALEQMKVFGVERDLYAYKEVLDVFPKGKMVARSFWDYHFMYFPIQQDCTMNILGQMENNGVQPDVEFGEMIQAIFGPNSLALMKYKRVRYWLPVLKGLIANPLPHYLPECPIEMAQLVLNRMVVDYTTELTVWKTSEIEEIPCEDTFIVGALSSHQKYLIETHPVTEPLFVEGGFNVWTRNKYHTYFILRAEAKPDLYLKPTGDEYDIEFDFEQERALAPKRSIHEQADGTILGMCITGTSSKDSLLTWIRYLQHTIPKLGDIPVIFTLRTPLEENTSNETYLPMEDS